MEINVKLQRLNKMMLRQVHAVIKAKGGPMKY